MRIVSAKLTDLNSYCDWVPFVVNDPREGIGGGDSSC